MSGHEVDVGEGVVGADIQICMHILKVGLLSVKISSFDRVNIWSPDQ